MSMKRKRGSVCESSNNIDHFHPIKRRRLNMEEIERENLMFVMFEQRQQGLLLLPPPPPRLPHSRSRPSTPLPPPPPPPPSYKLIRSLCLTRKFLSRIQGEELLRNATVGTRSTGNYVSFVRVKMGTTGQNLGYYMAPIHSIVSCTPPYVVEGKSCNFYLLLKVDAKLVDKDATDHRRRLVKISISYISNQRPSKKHYDRWVADEKKELNPCFRSVAAYNFHCKYHLDVIDKDGVEKFANRMGLFSVPMHELRRRDIEVTNQLDVLGDDDDDDDDDDDIHKKKKKRKKRKKIRELGNMQEELQKAMKFRRSSSSLITTTTTMMTTMLTTITTTAKRDGEKRVAASNYSYRGGNGKVIMISPPDAVFVRKMTESRTWLVTGLNEDEYQKELKKVVEVAVDDARPRRPRSFNTVVDNNNNEKPGVNPVVSRYRSSAEKAKLMIHETNKDVQFDI